MQDISEPLVHITLTQAEHNQLKRAMAKLIHDNHSMAKIEKEEAQYLKSEGHPGGAKQWYKFSYKSTDRANRLGKLQAKIKYPELKFNPTANYL